MPNIYPLSASPLATSGLPDLLTSGPWQSSEKWQSPTSDLGQRQSDFGPGQCRAFTLIELLVVIGVIVTLMGLLIPAVSLVKNKAKKTQTVNLLAQVQAACSSYKNENGHYPETGMTAMGWAGNAANLLIQLKTVNREDFRSPELKDSYGTVIQYRPAKHYPFTQGITSGLIDSDDPPGADSYQLWSKGPNKSDDVSTATDPKDLGDDIVTWKK